MVFATALLVALSGCADKGTSGAAFLRIDERDFRISAPKTLRAGRVHLVVFNKGPIDHELMVVRDEGRPLPLSANGLTLDEEALEPRAAGELEPGRPGAIRELDLRLRPGHYRLICNMTGHYLAGMNRELTVR